MKEFKVQKEGQKSEKQLPFYLNLLTSRDA